MLTIYMMENKKDGNLLGPAFTTSQLAIDSWELTCSKVPEKLDEYKAVGIPVLEFVDHL